MLAEGATSSSARLVLEGDLPGVDPGDVTAHFTDPELLTAWWPAETEIDTAGGFVFRWPAPGWTLRGEFLAREPGRHVAFTWKWDHEPDTPPRTVTVTTIRRGGGTHVTIGHGDYGPEDAAERLDHLEGWQHFWTKLEAALG